MLFDSAIVDCPYCGEPIELELDLSAGSQCYVEDCSVCCHPIEVALTVDSAGGYVVAVRTGAA